MYMRFKDFIEEGKLKKAIGHFDDIGMPKGKIKHSKRVSNTIRMVGGNQDARMAAAFHDYLERGGDLKTAKSMFKLSKTATNIIRHLSDPDKFDMEQNPNNGPLAHMQAILSDSRIKMEEKRIVVLIKIADRLDNLWRRSGNGVSKNYAGKSEELLSFLFDFYYQNFGKDKSIRKMHGQYQEINSMINKKRQLEVPNWKQWKKNKLTLV